MALGQSEASWRLDPRYRQGGRLLDSGRRKRFDPHKPKPRAMVPARERHGRHAASGDFFQGPGDRGRGRRRAAAQRG